MKRKRTLTFGDALRKQRPAAFGAMLKPVGSICNLDCSYCYYLDKERLSPGGVKIMSLELLEEFTQQYIGGNDVPVVSFCWHGGEPLMAGKEFFRKAIEFQNKYKGEKQIENSIQTNGTLLDQEWCELFARNNFLVGISIDGPEQVHNANRMNRDGQGSFERTMRGLEMLRSGGVEFNTLSAVSAASAGRGREIYRFLKNLGSRYMQFLPVVEYVKSVEGYPREVIVSPSERGAHRAQWSISARDYGRFMNDIFDDWVVGDVGSYYVQLFDATLAGWCGVRPGLCAFCESCGDALVVEHNGDVYSCDHFVYPEYRLGNIATEHLRGMFESPEQFRFGVAKREGLPGMCHRCRYKQLCNGECPKHRFAGDSAPNYGNEPPEVVNDLCQGLMSFYKHSEPYMLQMRSLIEAGQPASLVVPWARQRMGLIG